MIRLHHCHQTRSMRSLWLLYELGVKFEVQHHPFDKTLRAPAYAALNPTGRVPTLEIDGQVITESGAITEALVERFPAAGLGRAAVHPERFAWLQWLHFAETISQHTAALTQQHIAIYDDSMRSPTVMKLEAARLTRCLATLDAALGDYLLPSGFSAVDIGAGQAVFMAQHFVDISQFSQLSAWFKRLTARPAYQAANASDMPPLYAKPFYPPWTTK